MADDNGKNFNQAKYTLVGDFLIAQVTIDDANLARVVSCMTVGEFNPALLEDGRHIVKVLNKKTIDTHGPARVILTGPLYRQIDV